MPDFSQIKMVVSDMDGTLLNSHHQVSDKFFDLYDRLQGKNIQFVAASGRQYHSIADKLHPIKDEIVIIAENGGLVMYQDQELLSTPLPAWAKKEILHHIADHPEIHPVLCGKDKAHICGKSNAFADMLMEYYSSFHIMDDLLQHKGEVIKVALFHFKGSEKYIYPVVQGFEEKCKVKVSGANWVDISSPNAHKGHALAYLMKEKNLTANEVMVFGDYNNDLEMMALSNFSVAMANAHPNVKKTATYHTLDNDHFGVEHFLRENLLKS